MLNLSDLTAFDRIADLGSISAAARSLAMPKSSVSRSLMRLEETLGAVLVERSTRHLRMTDAGLLLKQHAKRILDDVAEAENHIGGLIGKPSGDLHVSAPFTFAVGPLAQMLPAFMAQYPQVRIVLSVENRPVDIQMEQVDVAIRIGPLQDSSLIARRITSFELWPCASPSYLDAHDPIVKPDDLRNHQLIAHADRLETWQFHTRGGGLRAFEFSNRSVIPEPDVLKAMLMKGAGIGLLPDFHARDAIEDGRLRRVLPDLSTGSVDAHALYPSHRSLSAKVKVFIDELIATTAKVQARPI